MDNKEITNPSMGSNELGSESLEENTVASILAGTDTQLHLTAMGGSNKKKQKPNIGNEGQKTETESSEEETTDE
jgi:hypothetical protein